MKRTLFRLSLMVALFVGLILTTTFSSGLSTTYSKQFSKNRYDEIRTGDSIETVYAKIGGGFYGWQTDSATNGAVANRPILPQQGDELTLEEIQDSASGSFRLSIFYSKQRSPYLPWMDFEKWVIEFENGAVKSKQILIESE